MFERRKNEKERKKRKEKQFRGFQKERDEIRER